MSLYFLETERLGFRLWSPSDLDLAMGLWGDPEVTRLFGGPFSREQVQERLAREIANWQSHGVQYWPIFLLAGGEHVGCCGLRPYKPEDRIFELGYHLRRAHWGFGYATEVGRAARDFAFQALGASGLFAGHHPENHASGRVLEKLGFRYTHDEYFAPTGLNHRSYLLTTC